MLPILVKVLHCKGEALQGFLLHIMPQALAREIISQANHAQGQRRSGRRHIRQLARAAPGYPAIQPNPQRCAQHRPIEGVSALPGMQDEGQAIVFRIHQDALQLGQYIHHARPCPRGENQA